jgi:hypothetical protein
MGGCVSEYTESGYLRKECERLKAIVRDSERRIQILISKLEDARVALRIVDADACADCGCAPGWHEVDDEELRACVYCRQCSRYRSVS